MLAGILVQKALVPFYSVNKILWFYHATLESFLQDSSPVLTW